LIEALESELRILLDERHRVGAREVGEDEIGLGVLDGGEVRRVVRVAERREGLADHGAARRGEGLLEMRRRLLAEGEVEHADIAAVAELGLGPGPERRGRLPGAVREAEVVAAAALLGEEVIGGDGVEPEALGVHDVVPDGRRRRRCGWCPRSHPRRPSSMSLRTLLTPTLGSAVSSSLTMVYERPAISGPASLAPIMNPA
jgi:hypothetical protein